eukprot:sb/3460463/
MKNFSISRVQYLRLDLNLYTLLYNVLLFNKKVRNIVIYPFFFLICLETWMITNKRAASFQPLTGSFMGCRFVSFLEADQANARPSMLQHMSGNGPALIPHIQSPPSTRHFAATFLEAQKVQYDKRSTTRPCAPPFCFLSSQYSTDSGGASSALRFAEYKSNPKYGSDRYLTKTLHLQNLAVDSQPSSLDSESQEEDFEVPDPPVQQCKRKDSKGRFGSLRKLSLKNLTSQNRMMRRAQSEAQVNLQPSPKKISSVPSLSSLKKAFLPLKFIGKTRKKNESSEDLDECRQSGPPSTAGGHHGYYSSPSYVVMETGFPATSTPDISSPPSSHPSHCMSTPTSPRIARVNFSDDRSHNKGTLQKQVPGGRSEMEDLMSRYHGSRSHLAPLPSNSYSTASLHRRLQEFRRELEDENKSPDTAKIDEIRERRNLIRESSSGTAASLEDDVFYKTEQELLSSASPPPDEDYYKEVEVRINPEGIAVVRRRHNAKPDKQNVLLRGLTKTLHLQNLAADSQPSSLDSESQEEDFEVPDPPVQQCKRKDSKGRFGSLRKLSLKNLTSQNRMMRRAQSEAQVNLQPSPKKMSSVPSLSSLKKAFLPLKFIGKTRRKNESSEELDECRQSGSPSTAGGHHGYYSSSPSYVVMETGFPATSTPDISSPPSHCMSTPTSPRIARVNFSDDRSHNKGTLQKQVPGGRSEMEDLMSRYHGSRSHLAPLPSNSYSTASLHRRLQEFRRELEDENKSPDTAKIDEIRERRNLIRKQLGHCCLPEDDVFYKTEQELLSSASPPPDEDYYKEVEVRINPEGIAVVRRRHNAKPDKQKLPQITSSFPFRLITEVRRSTIHVDDRVFCDKVVLNSIYGHDPLPNNRLGPRSNSSPKKSNLSSYVCQKSVPNLQRAQSDSEGHEEGGEADDVQDQPDVTPPSVQCDEAETLQREYHRSKSANVVLPKKYIKAYTKLYEQRLAVKLLDCITPSVFSMLQHMSGNGPALIPHIQSPPSTRHFAATFLEAQKVQYDKRSTTRPCAPPFCFLSSQYSTDSGGASSALRFAEYKSNPKYGSDRYLTKTLHLQNLAVDSQPSSLDSESQEEDFEVPDPPVQQCKRKDSKGRFGSLRKLSLKNLTSQNRMMRRAQSEAQVNLQPSPKKISSVPSLSSLKKAFLPLKFIGKTRKKNESSEDLDECRQSGPPSTAGGHHGYYSSPSYVVMETGFPATSTPDISSPPSSHPSHCMSTPTSPRIARVNFSDDRSHNKGTLQKQVPGGRSEMEDLMSRYHGSRSHLAPLPSNSYSTASLHRRLQEFRRELEDENKSPDTAKIDEIRERRNLIRKQLRHGRLLEDDVFYKTEQELLSSASPPPDEDYYKEVEVRINPEGIAVVRRRHNAKPDKQNNYEVRRSTIHVDDRVFCDKVVLNSIYGHDPLPNNRLGPHSNSSPKKSNLSSYVCQKSVPNLQRAQSDSGGEDEGEVDEIQEPDVTPPSVQCDEAETLKREYHRSKSANVVLPKKYIKAYTKLYEQRLAVKLLELNRFIKEERENKKILDERIRRSLLENDKLLQALNTVKSDILNMIESLETPVIVIVGAGFCVTPVTMIAPAFKPDVTPPSVQCDEAETLKREYHRSKSANVVLPKKYIKAYTKLYEQRLAVKLLELNRFIKEERENKKILDERIRRSLLENDKLLQALNTVKSDILNMIESLETPREREREGERERERERKRATQRNSHYPLLIYYFLSPSRVDKRETLCQEKKGPDKLAEKQVTDGQQKKQRVGDKKDNGKDSGENGDKQDSHDQVNQTNGGDDKDDTHGDIKNQDAADHHGDAVDLHGDTADGDGAGNHGDGEGNHGDGEVHKKTTEKAIVSDKDLINDPAFNVTKIFPTQAPQPVNKEGDDTKKKDKNTAEGDDDDENGDNKTGDVLVDFDVAPKPVKGNETETWNYLAVLSGIRNRSEQTARQGRPVLSKLPDTHTGRIESDCNVSTNWDLMIRVYTLLVRCSTVHTSVEPIIHSDKVVVVEEENEEGDDTKKKDKNTAEGDDDDENGDNKTGDVLVDFDVAPKPVKGNETETPLVDSLLKWRYYRLISSYKKCITANYNSTKHFTGYTRSAGNVGKTSILCEKDADTGAVAWSTSNVIDCISTSPTVGKLLASQSANFRHSRDRKLSEVRVVIRHNCHLAIQSTIQKRERERKREKERERERKREKERERERKREKERERERKREKERERERKREKERERERKREKERERERKREKERERERKREKERERERKREKERERERKREKERERERKREKERERERKREKERERERKREKERERERKREKERERERKREKERERERKREKERERERKREKERERERKREKERERERKREKERERERKREKERERERKREKERERERKREKERERERKREKERERERKREKERERERKREKERERERKREKERERERKREKERERERKREKERERERKREKERERERKREKERERERKREKERERERKREKERERERKREKEG